MNENYSLELSQKQLELQDLDQSQTFIIAQKVGRENQRFEIQENKTEPVPVSQNFFESYSPLFVYIAGFAIGSLIVNNIRNHCTKSFETIDDSDDSEFFRNIGELDIPNVSFEEWNTRNDSDIESNNRKIEIFLRNFESKNNSELMHLLDNAIYENKSVSNAIFAIVLLKIEENIAKDITITEDIFTGEKAYTLLDLLTTRSEPGNPFSVISFKKTIIDESGEVTGYNTGNFYEIWNRTRKYYEKNPFKKHS
jgi:hypothetical protein